LCDSSATARGFSRNEGFDELTAMRFRCDLNHVVPEQWAGAHLDLFVIFLGKSFISAADDSRNEHC
jgi:hypothetical protein